MKSENGKHIRALCKEIHFNFTIDALNSCLRSFLFTSGIPDPHAYGAKTLTSMAARTANVSAHMM